MKDIAHCLVHWSEKRPDRTAFQFASREGTIVAELTYGALAVKAAALARHLSVHGSGERAVLLFAPGLDFVVAMLACVFAGVIAVPMPLPRRPGHGDSADSIIENCTPRFVLTTRDLRDRLGTALARRPRWQACTWIAIDEEPVQSADPGSFAPSAGEIALLQYTSGSTSAPKGVVVRHANLMSNLAMLTHAFGTSEDSRLACWVPHFHDMGLIGNVLHALYLGATCILMAPLSFMQRPLAWLKVISEQRVDFAGCPNFGYDHCVSVFRSRPSQDLDLSCWRIAYNGAEPVRSATLEQFAATFVPHGFDRRALFPCYGMAEASVIISGKTDRTGDVIESRIDGRPVVSCGAALIDEEIAIVDPATRHERAPRQVGEIWVSGPHVAAGYWNNPEATAQSFGAEIVGRQGGWLRTGDLGFLDEQGELFVTGRLKDVIIIHGQNHYPQDIELSVQEAHPAFRHQLGAAFSAPSGTTESALVVVQEVNHRLRSQLPRAELEAAIREAVLLDHGLAVHRAIVVPPGTVPRTTSGKVQRGRARDLWLAGALGAKAEARNDG